MLLKTPGSVAERRLEGLAGGRRPKADAAAGALLRPPAIDLGRSRDWASRFISVEGLSRLYEQADVGLPFRQFLLIALGLALAGGGLAAALKLPLPIIPVCAALLGALPFLWLWQRKRKRIKKFTAQMPDALELVGRALRAGHGLASGLSVVAEEMPPPIAHEFGRVFEEQNLGIPLEDALRGLAERVPTMDVRFFVTAVIIQRATGGDLAEVLDKIGRLLRERFQILGQVQALTGEGRLSGVVLLAMPPALLAFTYTVNPDYTGLLFTTPVGTKMLTVAVVLQVIGALAIKKIVNIKV
ncbi:MAG: type II secretion system F family protein [Isosphaeraceae bacterium]|nr:type II secretion system F family protein [Isosphaeraceae bacterium]